MATKSMLELSDYEIADLTSKLKDSEAAARPLVGPREPIAALATEYAHGAPTYLRKIEGLEKEGWTGLRRLRGDGDCFYRAFAFAYVERLLTEPPVVAEQALSKLTKLLPLLDQAGFKEDAYGEFYEPLRDLLISLSPGSASRPTAADLLQSFNSHDVSDYVVVFLRLLTSAFLRGNADDFVPFLFGLEDDPRFFDEGVPTIEQFCSYHVEAVNKEADHIQITALTRALQINIRIAYLDQSPGASGEDGSKVDFHGFEPDSADKLACALLYRPGRYDCLYK